MEPNGLGGAMYSNMGSGMLGLELPLQQRQKSPPNTQNPHHLHAQMVPFPQHDQADHHHSQSQQAVKYPYAPKAKQPAALSDEDEPSFAADDSNSGDAKRKMSPWQRMKWTDSMVRLLIMAVYYIGDEAGSEGTDPMGKKKSAGLLQKKGKWKSVSRAMMEKGFYVSPQQCEDKFNDLNKRYKRVNDILGKGTACKVVENQSLLETMDLPPKMKEEVRKLLNSKHLFFREMCAYHNSCGHGVAPGGASHSPEVATEPSQTPQQQAQQQRCFHSSEHAVMRAEGSKLVKGGSGEEEEEDYEDDDDDSEDDEDDDGVESGSRGQNGHGHEDEDENDERCSRKRTRKGVITASSQLIQQLSGEVMNVLQDGGKTQWEKKQWIRTQILELEEQKVRYLGEGFELEKQRVKWVKFSSKKEREMERAKLENERRRLENERMVLLIRQKEMELLDLQQPQQHSSSKRGEPSSVTG